MTEEKKYPERHTIAWWRDEIEVRQARERASVDDDSLAARMELAAEAQITGLYPTPNNAAQACIHGYTCLQHLRRALYDLDQLERILRVKGGIVRDDGRGMLGIVGVRKEDLPRLEEYMQRLIDEFFYG